MLPAKLKNFMLFNDAQSYLGEVGEVTLPKLARKMEKWRGGGMLGEVDIDMGQEPIELEWMAGGMLRQVLRQFGTNDIGGVLLRFAGAYQRDDGGQNHLVEIVVKGRHAEIDMGNAKAGDDTEWKIKTSCVYYKLSIDGTTEVEIDMLHGLFNVAGSNLAADLLDLLGLATAL